MEQKTFPTYLVHIHCFPDPFLRKIMFFYDPQYLIQIAIVKHFVFFYLQVVNFHVCNLRITPKICTKNKKALVLTFLYYVNRISIREQIVLKISKIE